MKVTLVLFWLVILSPFSICAQTGSLSGRVTAGGQPLERINVALQGTTQGAATNAKGYFEIKSVPYGTYQVVASGIGYQTATQTVTLSAQHPTVPLRFTLRETSNALDEVVVTGTMKEVTRLESPVPVEIYRPAYFKKNPTPTLFEALQIVNGVRPQMNCNVCNTGDIHINGLEGPYTMVLLDGMPIVSGLSTVYGLNGIPNSLIERIEIIKGPASTLYGSEAVGGLINVITKAPEKAPQVSADAFATSWGEINADVGLKLKAGNTTSLLGINYFNYSNPVDRNGDGFTDITLTNRLSVFNKWNLTRKNNRVASLAGRYVYEDRWGGQLGWDREWRGTDSLYGESIYTKRYELIGAYQLPIDREKLMLSFSGNLHQQNSYYGTTPYMADQRIGFAQLTWDKIATKHSLLSGLVFRYTYYDDNTPATATADPLNSGNAPSRTYLPGVFVQDEITFNSRHKLLLGARYDYNSIHGSIFTPRLNYKFTPNRDNIFRLSFGNGYRVANVFTEDHAALTGARQVVFAEALKPERSYNGNLNYQKFLYVGNSIIGLDASAFYTYFTNKIIPDYETNPNQIIYANLEGHAVSRGITLNTDWTFSFPFKIIAGATLMDVYSVEENDTGVLQKRRQLLTERYSGTFAASYSFHSLGLTVDYTGNVYGPMKLPLLSELDPRPAYSPWFSIQNIQLTKSFSNGVEIYGGVKNLLNFRPAANSIARSFDPFDKRVEFDSNGQVVPTPGNPYALTFDPSYVYAANQGIRGFLGVRYNLFR